MRRHLQSSQMSDEDIKKEMNEFLEYLENRQRSLEHSDNDTIYSNPNAASYTNTNQLNGLESPTEDRQLNDDEGIHVYATEMTNPEQRFINIDDFHSL